MQQKNGLLQSQNLSATSSPDLGTRGEYDQDEAYKLGLIDRTFGTDFSRLYDAHHGLYNTMARSYLDQDSDRRSAGDSGIG